MEKQEGSGHNGWARWNAMVAAAAAAYKEEQREEARKKNKTNWKTTRGKILKVHKKERKNELEFAATPPLPEAFRSKIRALGGSEASIILVLKKVVTNSDVDPRQCRFLIPFSQVKNHAFLSEEEMGVLERGDRIGRVLLIGPGGDEEEVDLTQWGSRGARCNYLLVRNWSRVVRKNGLQVGDCVQLWGFRRGLQLGLALVGNSTFDSGTRV